jgi:hypothetical protein
VSSPFERTPLFALASIEGYALFFPIHNIGLYLQIVRDQTLFRLSKSFQLDMAMWTHF